MTEDEALKAGYRLTWEVRSGYGECHHWFWIHAFDEWAGREGYPVKSAALRALAKRMEVFSVRLMRLYQQGGYHPGEPFDVYALVGDVWHKVLCRTPADASSQDCGGPDVLELTFDGFGGGYVLREGDSAVADRISALLKEDAFQRKYQSWIRDSRKE